MSHYKSVPEHEPACNTVAEKAEVWTGIWGMILSLHDALLGLTWENYIYGSVVTAEIDFIKYRHGSVVFLLLKKRYWEFWKHTEKSDYNYSRPEEKALPRDLKESV